MPKTLMDPKQQRAVRLARKERDMRVTSEVRIERAFRRANARRRAEVRDS